MGWGAAGSGAVEFSFALSALCLPCSVPLGVDITGFYLVLDDIFFRIDKSSSKDMYVLSGVWQTINCSWSNSSLES